jgi:hypothetical protein
VTMVHVVEWTLAVFSNLASGVHVRRKDPANLRGNRDGEGSRRRAGLRCAAMAHDGDRYWDKILKLTVKRLLELFSEREIGRTGR